MLGETDDN